MRVLGFERTGELVTTTVINDSTESARAEEALDSTSLPSAVHMGSTEHEMLPFAKMWTVKSTRQIRSYDDWSTASQPSQHGL